MIYIRFVFFSFFPPARRAENKFEFYTVRLPSPPAAAAAAAGNARRTYLPIEYSVYDNVTRGVNDLRGIAIGTIVDVFVRYPLVGNRTGHKHDVPLER